MSIIMYPVLLDIIKLLNLIPIGQFCTDQLQFKSVHGHKFHDGKFITDAFCDLLFQPTLAFSQKM